MSESNASVEQHYFREQLFERILDAVRNSGITKVTRQDLAGVDEFHVRGAEVSMELAKETQFFEFCNVLDVGCGLGGPARMLADEFGCIVTGIDIIGEFVRTATLLSELVNLQDNTMFLKADALHLPFPDYYFDAVWTQHTQMNIKDKQRFYSEIKRVLSPGGRFIYYDIFSTGDAPLTYPLPWADDKPINHLITFQAFEGIMRSLGFKKLTARDQTAAGIESFNISNDIGDKDVHRKPGIKLVMGDNAAQKVANLVKALQEKKLVLQSGIYSLD